MISIPKRSELHRFSKLYKIFEHSKRMIVEMPGVQATKVNLYKERQWSQGSAWMLLEVKKDEKRLSLAIEKSTASCTVLHFGNLADIATAILSADTSSTKRIDSAVEAASKNPVHFPVGVLQREGITVEGPFGNFGERFEASFPLQALRRFVCDAMGGDTSCAESSEDEEGDEGEEAEEAEEAEAEEEAEEAEEAEEPEEAEEAEEAEEPEEKRCVKQVADMILMPSVFQSPQWMKKDLLHIAVSLRRQAYERARSCARMGLPGGNQCEDLRRDLEIAEAVAAEHAHAPAEAATTATQTLSPPADREDAMEDGADDAASIVPDVPSTDMEVEAEKETVVAAADDTDAGAGTAGDGTAGDGEETEDEETEARNVVNAKRRNDIGRDSWRGSWKEPQPGHHGKMFKDFGPRAIPILAKDVADRLREVFKPIVQNFRNTGHQRMEAPVVRGVRHTWPNGSEDPRELIFIRNEPAGQEELKEDGKKKRCRGGVSLRVPTTHFDPNHPQKHYTMIIGRKAIQVFLSLPSENWGKTIPLKEFEGMVKDFDTSQLW
jgi:hypothetical protein